MSEQQIEKNVFNYIFIDQRHRCNSLGTKQSQGGCFILHIYDTKKHRSS